MKSIERKTKDVKIVKVDIQERGWDTERVRDRRICPRHCTGAGSRGPAVGGATRHGTDVDMI